MKKILINLILILGILFLFECYSYSTIFVSDKFSLPDYSKFDKVKEEFLVDNHLYTNYEKPDKGDPIYFEKDGRSFVGENYKNKPILLLGDSYTYGLGLTKEETFGYQLSEYTKRPVYNWAWCTEGLEYSFLVLKEKRNLERLKSGNPEYVIYTYSYSAPGRLTLKQRIYRWYFLRQLQLIGSHKFSFFDRLYTVNFLKNLSFYNSIYSDNYQKNIFNFLQQLILEVQKEVNLSFSNSKFIVLLYSDAPELIKSQNLKITEVEEKLLNPDMWTEFVGKNSDKFIFITTEELIGRKMDKKEDIIENERTVTIHPSAKAWAEIVPALAKKLNLN